MQKYQEIKAHIHEEEQNLRGRLLSDCA